MASSIRPDLDAVRLVWWRKLVARLEFWLILVGYNPRTHSFDSLLYQVYVIVFFSIWIFMVLILLAGAGGQVLAALPFAAPQDAASALGVLAFGGYFFFELYAAARRSPFSFSEEDASLLCLTPVDRRAVALFWYLGGWLGRGLLLWPGAVVLGYALVEAQTPQGFTAADFPRYLLAGARMLAVGALLHLALQAAAWAAGAWRLQGRRDAPGLRWGVLACAGLFLAAWALAQGRPFFQALLWPLALPVRAGLAGAPFASGLGLALVGAAAGLALLWGLSRNMSLARASLETRGQQAVQAALLMGATDLVDELKQRERLGAGRRPSRLPARPGLAAVVWKNAVQGQRSLTFGNALPWASLLGLSLGLFLFPDWGSQVGLLVLWTVTVGQRAAAPLRRSLSRWWLLRQMPFAPVRLYLAEAALALAGIIFTGLAGMGIAALAGAGVPPLAGWLFVPGTVGVWLAAAWDLLRQCRAERLLAGDAPGLTLWAVFFGILALGIPYGAGWIVLARAGLPFSIGLLLALSLGVDYGLYRMVRAAAKKIR